MTKVVHCKKEKYDIYIGRPTLWGNPFIIGKDGNRDEVVEKFEYWVRNSNNDQAIFIRNNIHNLYNKTLGCWCKPHACHGDILVKILNEYRSNSK